ncbi:hypothetical protein ACMFMG_007971 [Clarireedia jacksonii]
MASILPCSLRRVFLPSFQMLYCYVLCRFGSGQSIDDQTHVLNQNFELLDLAQRPILFAFVPAELVKSRARFCVACLAIVITALAVTLRYSMNSSLLRVAMVSIVSPSQTLSSFVNYWTGIEKFLGSIARTRGFVAETSAELSDVAAVVSTEWPSDTSIELKDVSASYQTSGPEVI